MLKDNNHKYEYFRNIYISVQDPNIYKEDEDTIFAASNIFIIKFQEGRGPIVYHPDRILL